MSDFTVDISQNEYLPEGGNDVDAIITVTAPDTGLAAPTTNSGGAEIIIIDCSGSMRSPRTKIEQARAATAAAVDVIKDGVAFAVIAGTEKAVPIFPLDYGLAIADDQTRYLAKQAVSGVLPRGGTAIGQWLRLANTMFGTHPAELRHAILLTDGQNAHETPEQLGEAITEGLADVVVTAHVPNGYFGEFLVDVTFVAVARPEHPLFAVGHGLSFDDLTRYVQVVVRDSGIKHPRDEGWLGAERRCTVSSMEASLATVKAGLAYAWLPEHVVAESLRNGTLKPLPLATGKERRVPLHLVLVQGEVAGPAARAAAECFQRHVPVTAREGA